MLWFLFAFAAGIVGLLMYLRVTILDFNWIRFFVTFAFVLLACYGAVNVFHLT